MAAITIGGVTVAEPQASQFERAVISKYTLVPVGAVLAAVLVTFTVMRSVMSERERILVLETKVEAMESDTGSNTIKLDRISDDLLVIKVKLGIGNDPVLRPRTDTRNRRSHEDDF